MREPLEIKRMSDGRTVVDFGIHWFVVHPDGRVTRASGKSGEVTRRPATEKEAAAARQWAAQPQGEAA